MAQAIAIDLAREPQSAREARKALEAFRDSLDEISFIDMRLLVSELVGEAVREEGGDGPGSITVRAQIRDGNVWVEASEGADAYYVSSGRPNPGEKGWGIALVQRLSSRWGIRREKARVSTIWFEMPARKST
jgi:anti-sigma regulatory factor (Ser/Thr protein kinase)